MTGTAYNPPARFRPGFEIAWAARQHGERIAVEHGADKVSFIEVNRRCNRLANALNSLALEPQSRVAVLLNNSLESLDTVFAIAKAGLAYVALNTRHTAAEHHSILVDSGACAVIVGPGLEAAIAEAIDGMPISPIVISLGELAPGWRGYGDLVDRASDGEPDVWAEPSHLMRIQYTSGTTGKPKGITYDHAHYYTRMGNFFAALEYALGRDHSMAHVGPLTHAAGNYVVPYMIRGARNVTLPRFDPDLLQAEVSARGITHLLLVPTMISRLVEHLRPDRYTLDTISRINYGTAPINEATLRRGLDAFGAVFRQHYGLTEAPQPLTVLYPDEHATDGPGAQRLRSCGRPTLNVNLVVRGQDGVPVAPGEVGEITLEATGVAASGYWNNPEAEREAIRDGWLFTGDLGRMDDEGYLTIVGRRKDMIITGGFNVYSREVEEALTAHHAVSEAGVFGLPDAEWGERVCALVALRPGASATADDLIEHCAKTIASYKKPRLIQIVDALPKNASGKLDKRAMRADLTARMPSHSAPPDSVAAEY